MIYLIITKTFPTLLAALSAYFHYFKNVLQHISNTKIYFKIYIFTNQKLPNLHSSGNYWHDISNTNIYFQLTFIPPIVGSIYSIQIYISTNLYSQTLRPKGAQKLQQYIQPPSVGRIYPIPTCVQLTFIPQIVGCIYPIRYLYF